MKFSKSSLKCTLTISKVEQYFNVDTFWANPYSRVAVSVHDSAALCECTRLCWTLWVYTTLLHSVSVNDSAALCECTRLCCTLLVYTTLLHSVYDSAALCIRLCCTLRRNGNLQLQSVIKCIFKLSWESLVFNRYKGNKEKRQVFCKVCIIEVYLLKPPHI